MAGFPYQRLASVVSRKVRLPDPSADLTLSVSPSVLSSRYRSQFLSPAPQTVTQAVEQQKKQPGLPDGIFFEPKNPDLG
jgi:hypothetical protein